MATIGALAPGVRERFPDAVAAGRGSELAEALADVLAAVAAERPVLLFVDDYSVADRESQALLLTVARRLRHAAVCMLFTARTIDTPADLLAELRGRVGETRIRLVPLSSQDVEALLASMLEVAPDDRPALARRLYAESGGNPFYLTETTAMLLDEGRLTADARGVWRPTAGVLDGTLPVPPSIREAARRRFEALSPHRADGRRGSGGARPPRHPEPPGPRDPPTRRYGRASGRRAGPPPRVAPVACRCGDVRIRARRHAPCRA